MKHSSCYRHQGFTLIELMIALVILGLLAVVAIPAYNGYAQRSKLAEAMSNLSNLRLQMEQNFQDNRTFAAAGTTCAIANFAGNDFNFTCTAPTPTTFTWTATSKTTMGTAGDFTYSIDQNGNQLTSKFAGKASASTCWEVRPGKCS